MRDRINEVIDKWRKACPAKPTNNDYRELERNLLAALSSDDPLHADPEYIDARITWIRLRLAPLDKDGKEVSPLPDPRPIFERFLNTSRIAFGDQKILQWIMAYIYRAGFEHGKRAGPNEEYKIEARQ